MKIKALYGLIAIAATTTAVNADELNQTISVTKENETVEHKANKPEVFPSEKAASAKKVSLNFSDWTMPATIEPQLVVSQPQSQYDGFNFECRRGYAYLGMGNYLNISAAAGYRIVESRNADVALWLQHNSTKGSISNPLQFMLDPDYLGSLYTIGNGEKRKQFVVDDRLGLDVTNRLQAGKLTSAIGYHYSKFNYYGAAQAALSESSFDENYRQKVNDFSIAAKWESEGSDERPFGYHAGISYNYLGFADPMILIESSNPLKGMKEHDINVSAGAEFVWDSNSHAGIELAYQRLGYSNAINTLESLNPYTATFHSDNSGIFTIEPYYRKASGKINLLLGARIDLASTGTALRVAPDVKFDYSFNKNVALQIMATGGNRLNSIHSIMERNRYVAASAPYVTGTYTLVDGEVRLNIGPFHGFSISPFVGIAVVRNSLIPTMHCYNYDNVITPSVCIPDGAVEYVYKDRNGLKLGVDMLWKYRSLLTLEAKYTLATQSNDLTSGYTLGDDLAKHVVKASLTLTPIKSLDIRADYEFRSDRALFCTTDTDMLLVYTERRSLGAVSDLNLGATYRIDDTIRVFAQGNNLLNRRWQNYYGMRNQGIGFLVGVGVTF